MIVTKPAVADCQHRGRCVQDGCKSNSPRCRDRPRGDDKDQHKHSLRRSRRKSRRGRADLSRGCRAGAGTSHRAPAARFQMTRYLRARDAHGSWRQVACPPSGNSVHPRFGLGASVRSRRVLTTVRSRPGSRHAKKNLLRQRAKITASVRLSLSRHPRTCSGDQSPRSADRDPRVEAGDDVRRSAPLDSIIVRRSLGAPDAIGF